MNFEMDFISGDTKKCLLAVSLPMLAAMFLNMAYNLVDSLWIGNLMGETAYAALTGATPLILILESALYPSQGLCLVFMLIYLWKKKLFAFHISAFSKKWIIPLFAKGIPAAFQQSIPAVSTSFLTSLVSSYGISAIAAYGITGKLETILFYPAMALNMVLTTVTGQCIGGRRCDRAKDYIKVSLIYGCGLLAVLSAVVVLFARPLSGLFVDSEAAAEIVRTYFLIIGIGYILNTVTNCFLGAVNTGKKPVLHDPLLSDRADASGMAAFISGIRTERDMDGGAGESYCGGSSGMSDRES